MALYFATEKNPESDCAVYSTEMSYWYVDEPDPFTIKELGGVHPRHTDIRFINQGGVFTIHPELTKSMDLRGVGVTEFGVEAKASAKWQLRKMGIHASFIFPGLDSIARDILDEHDGLLQGGVIRHNLDRYMRRLAKEMSEESTQQK